MIIVVKVHIRWHKSCILFSILKKALSRIDKQHLLFLNYSNRRYDTQNSQYPFTLSIFFEGNAISISDLFD